MSEMERSCVICPAGCRLEVDLDDGDPRKVREVRGHRCPRGELWARQEVENPLRTLTSSVLVRGGDFPLASVRTSRPIPLERIGAVMEEIRSVSLDAPVEIGTVVLSRPGGCDTEIVITRRVRSRTD